MSFEYPVLRTEPEWDEIAGLLLKEQCSCVISHVEKGIRFYWERGVRDLYRLVSEEPEMLAGALVADKVVGKGAAALLACGKVSGVYALVVSTPARELLEQNGGELHTCHIVVALCIGKPIEQCGLFIDKIHELQRGLAYHF